eukprot:4375446-Alexandrium_andersonii.AAC.1
MWKAFDQLSRPALYALMVRSGWPWKLVGAYARYMEGLQVRSSFDGHVGQERSRPSSIPQGCPWSMAVLALATAPWAAMVSAEHPASTPRILADDLLV